jgi:hypothetical protein
MNFPTEINIDSEEERFKPIPAGTTVTVRLGQRYVEGEMQPVGDFHTGTTKKGDPYFVVPLVVDSGDYSGRRLSVFVNWSASPQNQNYLADLYEKVTGEDLSSGGSLNYESLVEGFKSGLFDVEVKLQRNNPQYNDVSRVIGRVGENTATPVEEISVEAPDDGDVPF